MPYEINYTDEFEDWWGGLTVEQQEDITARVELLEQHGPVLGRPTVDRVKGSAFQHMKELRCSSSGALRVLFAFDPRQEAILLLGGDKSGDWEAWYDVAIPSLDVSSGSGRLTANARRNPPETAECGCSKTTKPNRRASPCGCRITAGPCRTP